MAIADVKEFAHLSEADVEALGREFDQIRARIMDRDLPYWADPGRRRSQQINTNDGGRGLYWLDPDSHVLEILTVPYGGWPNGSSRLP